MFTWQPHLPQWQYRWYHLSYPFIGFPCGNRGEASIFGWLIITPNLPTSHTTWYSKLPWWPGNQAWPLKIPCWVRWQPAINPAIYRSGIFAPASELMTPQGNPKISFMVSKKCINLRTMFSKYHSIHHYHHHIFI